MDCWLSLGSSEFRLVVVNVNCRQFRFFASDNVICVHTMENTGHSLVPCFIVRIG